MRNITWKQVSAEIEAVESKPSYGIFRTMSKVCRSTCSSPNTVNVFNVYSGPTGLLFESIFQKFSMKTVESPHREAQSRDDRWLMNSLVGRVGFEGRSPSYDPSSATCIFALTVSRVPFLYLWEGFSS